MKLLDPTADDVKFFAAMKREVLPEIKARILVERAIIRKFCELVIAKGCALTIDDGEDISVRKSKDIDFLMANVCACDEEWLRVHNPAGIYIGAVWFVYGNDGWDVVCDYHTSLDTHPALTGVMDEVNKFAESLAD